MYGYLLSNTQILSPIETSIVMIAGLVPQDVSATAIPRPPRLEYLLLATLVGYDGGR